MLVGTAAAGLFGAYLALYLAATLARDTPFRFGDFFALWSYPQIARGAGAAALYDFPVLHAAQVGMGMEPRLNNPFPYPPTMLFLLWPLAGLPYGLAWLVWVVATLAAYVAAGWQRGRPALSLAALIVPTTTVTIVAGQSGFLTAALLLGGLRLAPARPFAAGVLFGLLTCKPQFGLLLPVALLAERRWGCIAATCATTAGLALAATLAFGTGIWAAWLRALPAYSAWFDTLTVRHLMPTVSANLELLGAPPLAVGLVQTLVAAGCAMFVWLAFRRFRRRLAIAALLVATCLATPHAFVYDLPLLSSAVLLVIGDRRDRGDTLRGGESAVLFAVLAFPAAMAFALKMPISTPILLAFAVLVARNGRASIASP